MEYDRKLEEFSNIVLREASEEKQKILTDVRLKISEASKKTKEDIIKKCESNLKLETEKTVRIKNETVSKKAVEIRKTIIEKRECFVEQMHNSLTKRLIEFTKSDEYIDWLLKQIEDAKIQLSDKNVVVYIAESDKGILNTIANKSNLVVKIDNQISIGGCKVVSEVKKMLVDNTFTKRMEDAFSSFHMLAIRN